MPLRPGALGRRRRARQMMRRLEELDRLDAQYGLGALPPSPRARTRRRRDWRAGTVFLLSLVVVCGLLINAGLRNRRNDHAPAITSTGGSFRFEQVQANGDPVGYNPCTPIRVEINPAGEPLDTEQLVRTAIQHIHEASGLDFELTDPTTSRRFLSRTTTTGRQPVIVGWSTAAEDHDLEGHVAGVGGSTMVRFNGHGQYVTGVVVLDAEAFRDILDAHRDEDAQAVVDHEFGHVVGLAHVKSRSELMFKENTGLTTWGPGDREGLARLGNIPCH
ncbi:hypothetical protein GCM10011584_01010 [Nocardioides phosphati]|uniref:Peptidase M10 metallopeptidase domain-containing protein n=1 Tax=Nocardioides phosphati TaxID=1867775 RepID=A0ABQ2N5R5_9ACTN|nr:matrixin family metalloprotease [Nocardioides phosphati]GGO84146.1 hypothetical protein GCM10011584_01010 [Nocardioides phosphati]